MDQVGTNESEPTLKDILGILLVLQTQMLVLQTEMTGLSSLGSDIEDIHMAVSVFAERTDKQFAEIRLDLDALKIDVNKLKATSVTKEYLDEKMATMYGNSMSVDKKVDKHVDAVVEILAENKTIAPEQKQQLNAMEPFPKLQV